MSRDHPVPARRVVSSSRYSRELDIAVEAAIDAGAYLRAAFTAPGGAPGHGGKSPADVEAERLIRVRLGRYFPDYGIRGEESPELDRSPLGLGGPRWLVDPNDGTDAFLSGRRGPSVSIGLVVGDRPVVGVVFSYAARSGYGDIFAWAEGGPLLRNGVRVDPAKRIRVDGKPIVLVSGGADTASAVNAAACAPARVRGEPSIAYRLALVAAGEAEAAISIHAPNDYDVAGGHALVLGAGGDLYGPGGVPIRYPPVWGKVGDCWGGVGEVPVELSRRDWSSVKKAQHERHALYPFVKSERSLVFSGEPEVLERACGCLLGQVAGDSFGSLVEFQSAEDIERLYARGGLSGPADGGAWDTLAGQPTDDSELALLLARSILAAGRYDPEAAARAYAWWHGTVPFDEGQTTFAALAPAWLRIAPVHDDPSPAFATLSGRKRKSGAADAAAGTVADAARTGAATRSESQANGALMRVSPLGVYGWRLPDDALAELARADAALTHANPICAEANAAYTVAVSALVGGAGRQEALDRARAVVAARAAIRAVAGHGDTKRIKAAKAVLETIDAARSGPPTDFQSNMGWVLVCLRNAFFRLGSGASFEEGVLATVRAGGDTDTNAAVAGALLGAADGEDAIPASWKAAVLTCRPIPGTCARPRPEPLWPVDVMRLAERLLVLGQVPPLPSGADIP